MSEAAIVWHNQETIDTISSVKYLYDKLLYKSGGGEYHLPVTFITMLLCYSPMTDNAIDKENSKKAMTGKFFKEVPDYALDVHTRRGKRKGRGLMFFYNEGSKINNEVKVQDDDFYMAFIKKYFYDYDNGLVTEAGYNSSDSGQKNLFG